MALFLSTWDSNEAVIKLRSMWTCAAAEAAVFWKVWLVMFPVADRSSFCFKDSGDLFFCLFFWIFKLEQVDEICLLFIFILPWVKEQPVLSSNVRSLTSFCCHWSVLIKVDSSQREWFFVFWRALAADTRRQRWSLDQRASDFIPVCFFEPSDKDWLMTVGWQNRRWWL